jgi:hypothetical protein
MNKSAFEVYLPTYLIANYIFTVVKEDIFKQNLY